MKNTIRSEIKPFFFAPNSRFFVRTIDITKYREYTVIRNALLCHQKREAPAFEQELFLHILTYTYISLQVFVGNQLAHGDTLCIKTIGICRLVIRITNDQNVDWL